MAASLLCGLHKFCLKYFLKTLATLTHTAIAGAIRPTATPDLTFAYGIWWGHEQLCAFSVLVFIVVVVAGVLCTLGALTQFVLTFAQLTHPLECR